jgi:tRNA(Arg) A34 adenosine deaminase TadA
MCAAAHGWVGLGRIVYAASSKQLTAWLAEIGVGPAPVRPFPASEIAPSVTVEGPVPEFVEDVRMLHLRMHGK